MCRERNWSNDSEREARYLVRGEGSSLWAVVSCSDERSSLHLSASLMNPSACTVSSQGELVSLEMVCSVSCTWALHRSNICCVEDWRKPCVSRKLLFFPPKLLGFEFLWRCSCILLTMASTLSGEVFIAGCKSYVGKGI